MTNSPIDLPYLPDDLLLNCLACVSRLYYPILSLVSKRFRSLVASQELYDIRTLLGRTENCLYMCLRSGSNPRWFTLCQRPTPTPNPNPSHNPNSGGCFTSCFRPVRIQKNCTRKEENASSENIMVPVHTRSYCPQFGLTSTFSSTIGTYIYMIGGYINGANSSRVFIFDCRSHTWHEAPSMWVARKRPLVNVLDGKIYVVNRKETVSSSIEFFDPKTQIWKHVSSPNEMRETYLSNSFVFDEKLYLVGYNKCVVYKPKENIWEVVRLETPLCWLPCSIFSYSPPSSCVIDNVLYCYNNYFSEEIQWYFPEGRFWKVLEGLEELPKLPKRSKLVDYGGKIAVVWEKKVCCIGSNKKMIWCDVVLTVPKSCSLLQLNTVTL